MTDKQVVRSLEEVERKVAAFFAEDLKKDLHRVRAAEHFGIPIEQVTAEQRRVGKRLNHLSIYAGGK